MSKYLWAISKGKNLQKFIHSNKNIHVVLKSNTMDQKLP